MQGHMKVKIVWNLSPYFNIAFMGKSVSNYVVSTNIADLWTIYDVKLRGWLWLSTEPFWCVAAHSMVDSQSITHM